MHYELYADSLFLMNFGMNLYLLFLVNYSTMRTSGGWRLLLGAGYGSLCYFILFLGGFPLFLRILAGGILGTVGMILIAFPVKHFRMFLKLLERLVFYSFCMGGAMLALLRVFPWGRVFLTKVWGILAVGGICFVCLRRGMFQGAIQNQLCRATLHREKSAITVMALVDSGNSLTEPISGKPVCVVEEKIVRGLWGKSMKGFRAIPFHSVGQNHGILEGYLLPGLSLEMNGVRKELKDVYIAVSREALHPSQGTGDSSIKMIVNPLLLSENSREKPKKRQNVRVYDSENSNTGENAV